jgi:quercetin dioxygenase-like cupin family protein
VTETLKLTPTESVTIRERSPEALEVEAVYGPGGSPPPKHFHPGQSERFEVVSGELRARVGGKEHRLSTGEVLAVPTGAAHQMWNPGPEPARVLWRTTPPGRTEQWFRSLDTLHRSGRVGSNGTPGPLAFGVLLSEYSDVFRLVGPQPLLRPALTLLGAIGRARGYRAVS